MSEDARRSTDQPQKSSRGARRPLWRVALQRLALGGVVFGAAVGGYLLVRDAVTDYQDRSGIEAERSRRAAFADRQQPLPGTPDLGNLSGRLAERGLALGAPIFMRVFKLEFELELWMLKGQRFELLAVYPICRWSGTLGPKLQEGDNQSPEGFYTVDRAALNPASRWHRSFNLGFPNAFDRAHGRTGSFLMVHGACVSIGCYAMTDTVVDEIWRLVTAALQGGQRRFHVHVFPFRLSEDNIARREHHPAAPFWRDLKVGHDLFEATRLVPRIAVCERRYIVTQASDPAAAGHEIANSCINLTRTNG